MQSSAGAAAHDLDVMSLHRRHPRGHQLDELRPQRRPLPAPHVDHLARQLELRGDDAEIYRRDMCRADACGPNCVWVLGFDCARACGFSNVIPPGAWPSMNPRSM